MTGGYDNILQPLHVDDRFDYILFSNDFKEKTIGVWEVRPIIDVVDLSDNKRLSRYPKSHPEALLSEYDASLYIDANLQIVDNWIYNRVVELYNANIEYAGVKLVISGRDCIYDHMLDMCIMGVEHDYNAARQCHVMLQQGFPSHFGLNENNIIYRKHTDKMKTADEEWWWWISNYSFRDQFSYMFCLWKHNIAINYIFPEGEDSRNSSHINYIQHDNKKTTKRIVKKGFLEYLRNRSCSYNTDLYYSQWKDICKNEDYSKRLVLWGIKISFFNIHKIIEEILDRVFRKIMKILNF